MSRPIRQRFCRLLAPILLAAATLAADGPTAPQEELHGLLEELHQVATEASGALAGVAGGPASPAAFDTLARLRRRLEARGDGSAALAACDADGGLLSWAGNVGSLPHPDDVRLYEVARLGTAVRFRAAVRGPGDGIVVAERHLQAGSSLAPQPVRRTGSARQTILYASELPRDTPGRDDAVPLRAPDGTILAHVVPLAPWSNPVSLGPARRLGQMIRLAAGAALLLLLVLYVRRRSGHSWKGVVGGTLAIAAIRLLLQPGPTTRALSAWTGAELYSTPAPFGLLSSPVAVLLSGLALLGGAVLVLRGPSLHGAARMLMGGSGLLASAGLAVLVRFLARDSQADLVQTSLSPDPRGLVQLGFFFLILAPLLLAAPLWLGPERSRRPVTVALLSAPAAALLLFVALTAVFHETRRELVEHNLRPVVRTQHHDRRHALEEALQTLQESPEIAGGLAGIDDTLAADQLAYRLWASTDLARWQARSAVEIFAEDGRLVGRYGLDMPPPVAGDGPLQDNLLPVAMELLIFSTLGQEEHVLHSRFAVEGEAGNAGSIAVYIADELDNLPPVRPAATRDVQNALGSGLVAMSYSFDGRLLWSAHTDPPPLPADVDPGAVLGLGEWRDARSSGTPVRLFYFPDDEGFLHAVGFHVESRAEHAIRALRLLLFCAVGLTVLLAGGFVLLTPVGRTRTTLGNLLRSFRASFGRKLAAAMLMASLLPLVVLSLTLRTTLAGQRRAILVNLGQQSLRTAERVVRDAIAAGDDARLPSDNTLYWLSRVLDRHIDLFDAGRLAATSRRGVFTAGLISPVLDADAFRGVVLDGRQSVISSDSAGIPTRISAPLYLGDGQPAVLSLPLDRARETAEVRSREARDLTDLTTAAVALLLFGTSVVVGRGMSFRLARLTAATQDLAGGAAAVRVTGGGPDEMGRLTDAFNEMAENLEAQRSALRRRTETLEAVLQHAPAGIITLNDSGEVALMNPAASTVLGIPRGKPGTPLQSLLSTSDYGGALLGFLHESDAAPKREAVLTGEGSGEERLRAVAVPLPPPRGGRLLVLEDLTETVRSNKLAAWAEMARRIAHEIKNPLTPIRLSAEHLRRVWENGDADIGETLVRTVETILEQVRSLQNISSEFSLYARIPAIERAPLEMGPFLEAMLAPYVGAPPEGVDIAVDLENGLPVLHLDAGLLRRALVNLVENALHAMPDGGGLQVRARREDEGGMRIEVEDSGVGMDAATAARVFEPYFSTRDSGTGLGLAIAARAVEEHGGRMSVDSTPGRGSRFTVHLPPAGTPRDAA